MCKKEVTNISVLHILKSKFIEKSNERKEYLLCESSERNRHRLKAVLGERPCELHSGASGIWMPAGFAAVIGFE